MRFLSYELTGVQPGSRAVPALRCRNRVALFCALLASFTLQAQNKDRLIPREANQPYGPQDDARNPYGLKRSNQTTDKDQIDGFLRQEAGLGDGKIEESEVEEVLRAFQRKYQVYVPDRDVLLVSQLDRKGLAKALENSLLKSNTTNPVAESLYRTSIGQMLPWKDLARGEKDAILLQIQMGLFEQVQPGVKWPGLRNFDDRFQSPNDPARFDPNGNLKTSPVATRYDNPQTVGASPAASRTVFDLESFYEFGPDFNELDLARRATYSNGRPRFDAEGNELHANGRRKFSDNGTPLYSNGRPRVDADGNKLHSNGRRKATNDGRPLYASGQVRKTREGVELHRGGRRRWTGDGQGPDAVAQAQRDFANSYANPQASSVATQAADSTTVASPKTLYDDARGPMATDQEYTNSQQIYADGRAKESTSGVKLHANGRRRFTGDGIGDSTFEPDTTTARKPALVQSLYSNARPAQNKEGDRLYSSASRRATNQGEYLYSNGRQLANAANQALTPSATGISPTAGRQGRPQGTYRLFRIVDGVIERPAPGKLIIRPRNASRGTIYELGDASIARVGPTGVVPGNAGQLARGMKVRLILSMQTSFVDGQTAQEDEPALVGVITEDQRVGLNKVPDGSRQLWIAYSGISKKIDRGVVQLSTNGRTENLALAGDAVVVEPHGDGLWPRDLRSLVMGRRVDVVVTMSRQYANGKPKHKDAPVAVAILTQAR